ncbi:Hypothetical predicted protein [Lynx pardinus]|uniref:Uncharacterized protein n=1 Tax=Lynx pardinus TaxID=191816 RepID=A0A485NAW1_LYNPA|nr:Hypothetical predicted protein [Lynx pardinus]
MKILVFAFIMALMVAMIGADSSEEKLGWYPPWFRWYLNQPRQYPWILPVPYPAPFNAAR